MKTRHHLPAIAIFLAIIMTTAPVGLAANEMRGNHSIHALYDIFNGETAAERIHPFEGDQTFSVDEKTYVYHAFFFERDVFHDYLPFDIRLFVDGQEVSMMRFVDLIPNALYRYSPGPDFFFGDKGSPDFIFFNWFIIFEPGDFEPGTYSWQVIWTNGAGFYLEANSLVTFV